MLDFIELGYFGLFMLAFLAATILPLGSEFILVALLLNEFNPVAVVAVATVGNVFGSVVNYAIGFYGSTYLLQRFLKIPEASFAKSRQQFESWGTFSLLLAWVPIIGDPLTVIAGVLRINIWIFLALVTIGKLGRYLVVTYVTLG